MNSQCLNRLPGCVDPTTGEIIADPDFPFRNLSAERPDTRTYPVITWPDPNPDPFKQFVVIGCLSKCVSDVSLEEALLCAQQQAIICDNGGCVTPPCPPPPPPQPPQPCPPWGCGGGVIVQDPGGGGPPGGGGSDPVDPGGGGGPPGGPPKGNQPPLYYSAGASCTVSCPDGSLFTKIVAPGKFSATTQAMADKKAQTYACAAANDERICLGDLPSELEWMCCNHEASGQISISGHHPPYTVSLQGSQPPGLNMVSNETGTVVTFEGTPTANGTYVVTLKAEDQLGNFNDREYTMRVIGLTQPSGPLPDTLINVPYTAILSFGGPMTEPVVWSYGGMPHGLSGDQSGLITGTPTIEGNYTISVAVTDANQRRCFAAYTLHVIDCDTEVFSGVETLNLGCGGSETTVVIPPALCERGVRIQSFGFRDTCPHGQCPDPTPPPEDPGATIPCYNFGLTMTVKVLNPAGGMHFGYTVGAVEPFPRDINQNVLIPAQLGPNPSAYTISIKISGTSVSAPGWTCVAKVLVKITGL